MPSVSKAQARYVRWRASKGDAWAKQWASEEGPTKGLPERKGKHPKASFKAKARVA